MYVSAFMPSPTLSAEARAASASRKRSSTSFSTMTRLVAVHFWPVDSMAPAIVSSVAFSTSASFRTTTGFLPPISSWNFAPRWAAWTARRVPTSLDPVKLMALIRGSATRACPTCEPRPTTRFRTPAGRPAFSSTSTKCHAVMGVSSAGFSTTVLP